VQRLICSSDSTDIKGGAQGKGFLKYGAKENIWDEERWSDRRLEKTA
jgi:hypothetical protein